MKIEIGNYLVEIQLLNGFTKREITKNVIEHITTMIKQNVFFDNYDIWGTDNFPKDIEETTTWDQSNYGIVFNWKVIDYKKDLYPTFIISDKNLQLCYQYHYLHGDYEGSTEIYCFKEKPIFNRDYKLLNIGYCSKNLIKI